jgi:hypothetical protein
MMDDGSGSEGTEYTVQLRHSVAKIACFGRFRAVAAELIIKSAAIYTSLALVPWFSYYNDPFGSTKCFGL